MIRIVIFLFATALVAGCSAPQNPNIGPGDSAERLASEDLDATIVLSSFDASKLNAAIFYASNEARIAEGLEPVEHSALLEELATSYAKRVDATGTIAHVDPETGTDPKARFEAAGITNPFASENLATDVLIQMKSGEPVYEVDASKGLFSREPRGEPLPFHTYSSLGRSFVESWLNSPGHRRNLLEPRAKQLGTGSALDTRNSFSPKFPVVIGVQKFQNFEELRTD